MPYKIVHKYKLIVAYLVAIRAQAYVLNTKLIRREKLVLRTLVGQLVGYNSINIY